MFLLGRMCKFSGTLRGEAMRFFKECRKCLFVRSFDAKGNVVVVPPVPSFHGTSDRLTGRGPRNLWWTGGHSAVLQLAARVHEKTAVGRDAVGATCLAFDLLVLTFADSMFFLREHGGWDHMTYHLLPRTSKQTL